MTNPEKLARVIVLIFDWPHNWTDADRAFIKTTLGNDTTAALVAMAKSVISECAKEPSELPH